MKPKPPQRISDPPSLSDDRRWAAVAGRDPQSDGRFVYSVKTTGIYCRPTCRARLALRRNVAFHATCAEAETAGFRPCQRCRPRDVAAASEMMAKISVACRLIEAAVTPPSLNEMAAAAGLSASHFHRTFKSIVGVTPKDYTEANRHRRVRGELIVSETVTFAIFDSGFNSSGRFYATAQGTLGMTPTRFRKKGESEVIRFAIGDCSLGCILVAASRNGICAVLLGDDAQVLLRDLEDRFTNAELIGADAEFDRMAATVIAHVETPSGDLGLPLDIRGTAFQHKVWQALRDIPSGAIASYTQIANETGHPKAVRAVAGACAANALAVIVPCHRVVRTDGDLSGYRWGIERKRELLRRERR